MQSTRTRKRVGMLQAGEKRLQRDTRRPIYKPGASLPPGRV